MNGTILVRDARLPQPDGSLSEPVDLHVARGRIAAVTRADAPGIVERAAVDQYGVFRSDVEQSDGILDAQGRVAMPGFVDAHTHAEAAVFEPDVQLAMLRQGITTVVAGQDGVSFAPTDRTAYEWASAYFAAVNGSHPTFAGGSVGDLLTTYHRTVPVNVAYLVPHGTLRYRVLGAAQRPASDEEIAAMVGLLERALDDGACGFSTGLEYVPAAYADERELIALAKVAAARGLPHVSHMRGYEDRGVGAFEELMRIARVSDVATHVSHLHGPAHDLLEQVRAARAAGHDVTYDSYPYLRGCSILSMVALPTWLPLADPAATVDALRDPAVTKRLGDHFAGLTDLWPRITFASVPGMEWAEGMTLPDVASRLGRSAPDTVVEILTTTALRASCVFAQPPTNSPESVRTLAGYEGHLAGSDAIYWGGQPHPRGWGAFARFLDEHVRSGSWSWWDAAEHLSARAARRFALADRGELVPGAIADIALVDPGQVRDEATYETPRTPASGIEDVLVGGVPVLAGGVLTGATPGHAVRPPPA
ncbi:N-acyl-D-amino-acid deacylase family protein [Promicromonospora soli]|uniref:N-acyl-D-aspartate/D-glutamate deacylase n=1 Tax=Promicromonospora soli TaxID=2035533 RepID=A0A919G0Y8_9MICO|nr:amidohydrolase family protein [Promicromonospora soli]GHH75603.1 N-acyl-D-aspartate/D-glutamate deacylase [Promicromonospora soli]